MVRMISCFISHWLVLPTDSLKLPYSISRLNKAARMRKGQKPWFETFSVVPPPPPPPPPGKEEKEKERKRRKEMVTEHACMPS